MAPYVNPFTPEQETQIVFQFGKLGRIVKVRRWFRREFNVNPRDLPNCKQFDRVVKRFQASNSTKYGKSSGRPATSVTDENVSRVRDLISADMTLSIRMIVSLVALSFGSVWIILRKKLKLYPYRPHNVIPLTDAHKNARVEFCEWFLAQPDGFHDLVYFSDEKVFEEKTRPNRQTERYWCNVDPEIEDENRIQGGRKIMCWAGLIDGKVVLHWFDEGERENQHIYLNMLQTVAWPAVSNVATRRGYWWQQDGATCHTTALVLDWLRDKFGDRIISNKSERRWPPKSPDLSPLDYWFWSVCLAELRRSPPASIEELKQTVTEFANSLTPEEIKKAVGDIIPRAEACIMSNGGAFEYRLKKHKRGVEE